MRFEPVAYVMRRGGVNRDILSSLLGEISGGGAWNTFTGSIIRFLASKAAPIRSIIASIAPVQDLHGYDNPWPAGGGKNLWAITLTELKSLNTQGTWTDNVYVFQGITYTVYTDSNDYVTSIVFSGTNTNTAYTRFGLPSFMTENGVSYIFNGCPVNSGLVVVRNTTELVNDGGAGKEFTGNGAANGFELRVVVNAVITTPLTLLPMIRLASVTDSTFAPYENICPISGRTGCNVYQSGKNLFDKVHPNIIEGYFGVGQPSNIVDGVSFRTVYIPATPNTTYTVKNNASNRLYVGYNDIAPISGGTLTKSIASVAGVATITTDGNAHYLAAYVYNSNADTVSFDDVLNGLQIELGSTATAYEPYSGTTIPVTFPTPPGTVYGGTLDVVSGKLTVTWVKWQPDPSVTPNTTDIGDGWVRCAYASSASRPPYAAKDTFAGRYSHGTYDSTKYNGKFNHAYVTSTRISYMFFKAADAEAVKTFLAGQVAAGTPVELCYEIDEPIVYDLTPEEITTLLGTNVMWADTGDITVTARGTEIPEPELNAQQSLNLLLGGRYVNNGGADEPSDEEALQIILGGDNR